MIGSISRLKSHEKLMFVFGIVLTLAVFYVLNTFFMTQGMLMWAMVETAVMWLSIIALLLLADNQRVLNEELKQILRENIEESKTLKKISQEQLEEIRILNKIIAKKR